jgi:hypothetical protein
LLEKKIGAQVYDLIKNSQKITFHSYRDPEGVSKTFTDEQSQKLKKILLNDNSYILDRVKKCVFIPDGGTITFYQGEQTLSAILSYACKQLKVMLPNGNTLILEIDPSFDELVKLVKTLGEV